MFNMITCKMSLFLVWLSCSKIKQQTPHPPKYMEISCEKWSVLLKAKHLSLFEASLKPYLKVTDKLIQEILSDINPPPPCYHLTSQNIKTPLTPCTHKTPNKKNVHPTF